MCRLTRPSASRLWAQHLLELELPWSLAHADLDLGFATMLNRLFKQSAGADADPAPALTIRDALLSERPSDTFAAWARSGRLRQLLPDLDALRGISQQPAHRDDAFIHTLKVVDAIEPTLVRRWSALLHDIGKGPTFIETPEGRSRFFEHDKVGVVMVGEIMPGAGESS